MLGFSSLIACVHSIYWAPSTQRVLTPTTKSLFLTHCNYFQLSTFIPKHLPTQDALLVIHPNFYGQCGSQIWKKSSQLCHPKCISSSPIHVVTEWFAQLFLMFFYLLFIRLELPWNRAYIPKWLRKNRFLMKLLDCFLVIRRFLLANLYNKNSFIHSFLPLFIQPIFNEPQHISPKSNQTFLEILKQ